MTTPILRALRTARGVTISDLSGGGDVVVLAPHPDDESLGCGGAIAALTEAGRRVQVIVVTDGAHSHPGSRDYPGERLRQVRAAEVARAVDVLTFGQGPAPLLLDYPDNDAPDTDAPDADAALARLAALIGPSVTAIWCTWGGDPHPDHRRTARMAARLVAERKTVALWSYPIWGRFDVQATGFLPDRLVQFETHAWQGRKASAMAAHASQMTDLITDDPGGFRMTDAHQRHFLTTPEIFLQE